MKPLRSINNTIESKYHNSTKRSISTKNRSPVNKFIDTMSQKSFQTRPFNNDVEDILSDKISESDLYTIEDYEKIHRNHDVF